MKNPSTISSGESDERTPQDYAIEHAEYMAAGVEHLLTEVNDMMQAGRSSRDAAEQDVFEAASKVQSLVYEFRKRRDRATLATQPAESKACASVGVEPVEEGCTPADARMLWEANHGLAAENEQLRAALQYYADKRHFLIADEDAWDTVSGEPTNFWCDEAGTATIEDGTVAAMTLRGTPLVDDEEEYASPAPSVGEPAKVSLAPSRVGWVYLAGPMTGYDDYNFPLFNRTAASLRAEGFNVINPAEHGIVEGAEWADYLRFDLAKIAGCESIALLPGWEASKGARLEVHVAQALGMSLRCLDGATPPAAPAAASTSMRSGVHPTTQTMIADMRGEIEG